MSSVTRAVRAARLDRLNKWGLLYDGAVFNFPSYNDHFCIDISIIGVDDVQAPRMSDPAVTE